MKTILTALVATTIPLAAHAQTYGPYAEQTYTACGNPKSEIAIGIAHGGWNLFSDRSADAPMLICRYAAARGIYAVSINYRLVTDNSTSWPAQWQDVQTAVRWLRTTHKRVGVVGISAGGYDALGATMRADTIHWAPTDPQRETRLYGNQLSQPDFVVAISPFSDLSAGDIWPGAVTRNISGLSASGLPAVTAQTMASPLSIVRSDTPPILIFHGRNDTMVPVTQSRALVSEMNYIGERVTYIETAARHGLDGLTSPQQRTMLQQIVNFAKRGHP